MLSTLTVKNFAIIDNINIDFNSGLTVITGETGAGKSLLIDAIGLLLGDRASPSMIRSGYDKAIIEGVFVNCHKKIQQIIAEYGIDYLEDEMLVIRREINDKGKSITRINGSVVTLSQLEQLSKCLADVHTQGDTKRLFDTTNYLEFIDNEQTLSILEQFQKQREDYRQKLKKYLDLQKAAKEDADNLEFLKFRRDELARANIKKDEINEIEKEITVLNNFDLIFKNMSAIKDIFESNNIIDGLYEIKTYLEKLSMYNSNFEKYIDTLNSSYYEIEDFANDINTSIMRLEFDEDRLNILNERISFIHNLERRYHMTSSQLIDYLEELNIKVNRIDQYDIIIEDAYNEVNHTFNELQIIAKVLSSKRIDNARLLEYNIKRTLSDLCLDKVEIKIVFNSNLNNDILDIHQFSALGTDDVDILISFNVGEELKPLSKVASGGEMSRVMLALKTHLLENMHLSTIIFDEIDSGVSGQVAAAIAEKMRMISEQSQVLAISHLPIVAAAAKQHLHLTKEVINNRTITNIEELNYEKRVIEVAKMISASDNDEDAFKLSRSMIKKFEK